eukprot:488187_1
MALHYLLVLFITCVFGHKNHNCIHDKIDHQISQQFVQYHNHPLSRKLLQSVSTPHSSIRIRPYYDPILFADVAQDKLTDIKSLVSSSIHYLEQFVNVIPIHGPLFINRCQRIWHHSQFTYSACPLSDYTDPLKCQYATIPDAHIAESWYYDPITLKSTLHFLIGHKNGSRPLPYFSIVSCAPCLYKPFAMALI